MWRVDTPSSKNPYADGRWRFCLHDIDFGCDATSNDLFLSKGNLDHNKNLYRRFPMFDKLARNVNFRQRFYNRARELINTNLSSLNVVNVLNRIYDETRAYKIQSQIRWGANAEAYPEQLKNIVDSTKLWMVNRSLNYLSYLRTDLTTWGPF